MAAAKTTSVSSGQWCGFSYSQSTCKICIFSLSQCNKLNSFLLLCHRKHLFSPIARTTNVYKCHISLAFPHFCRETLSIGASSFSSSLASLFSMACPCICMRFPRCLQKLSTRIESHSTFNHRKHPLSQVNTMITTLFHGFCCTPKPHTSSFHVPITEPSSLERLRSSGKMRSFNVVQRNWLMQTLEVGTPPFKMLVNLLKMINPY